MSLSTRVRRLEAAQPPEIYFRIVPPDFGEGTPLPADHDNVTYHRDASTMPPSRPGDVELSVTPACVEGEGWE